MLDGWRVLGVQRRRRAIREAHEMEAAADFRFSVVPDMTTGANLMSDTFKRCSVRDGRFIEPCASLEGVFDGHAWGKGRGLFLQQMTHLPTGKPSRSFVVLRMGEHKEKGIVLNCCPFCGERIDAPVANDEAA